MRNGTITAYPKAFEPGSTFKPIVVASALEMGAITTDATYVCDGGEFVTDTEIKCDNIYGHGDETLSDVIKIPVTMR